MIGHWCLRLALVCAAVDLMAAGSLGTGSLGSGSLEGSGSLSGSRMPPLEPPQREKKKVEVPPPPPLPEKATLRPEYPYPGVVVEKNGRWVGSDLLAHLDSQIAVLVSVHAAAGIREMPSASAVYREIEVVLRRFGIDPQLEGKRSAPPLPFLHCEILVSSCGEYATISATLELFEKVEIDRVILQSWQAMQGITWRHTNLLVAPFADLESTVKNALEQLVSEFASRYRAVNAP